jgi:glycogen(starch) synthase
MRILLLGPYPPPHGGVEMNLVAIRRFLLARQIPCEVINLTRFRKKAEKNVHYPANAWQLLALLLRLRFDIAHLHIGGKVTWRLLGLGLLCSLLPGRRTVLTLHSGGYPATPEGRNAHPRSLRGFLFRRFDRLIAVNPEIRDVFHRFGVPPWRTREICPFGFPGGDPGLQPPAGLEGFCRMHKPLLVTVSGLEPEYDVPVQIEALGSILEKHPQAGLVIIGSGSLAAKIRDEIQQRPYAEHVLLCGDLPHALTLWTVAQAALFLRTTLYDGDAISVREALHLGVPVIATDTCLRPEGVRLIPARDLAALCRAILEALTHPEVRRRRWEADESNLLAVWELYQEVLRKPEAR